MRALGGMSVAEDLSFLKAEDEKIEEEERSGNEVEVPVCCCLLYTSPSPRD